jgi:hypothetical protein
MSTRRHRPRRRRSLLVVALSLTALGLTSCSPGGPGAEGTGQFATAEIEQVIRESVTDNGLVSMRPANTEKPIDLLATSVLHRAGAADLPQPDSAALGHMCATYGALIPPHQVSGELGDILPSKRFLRAAGELDCVTLEAPTFRPGANQDAQQFLLAAATWSTLPGTARESLAADDVRAAVAGLSEDDAASAWSHWTCRATAEAIGAPGVCDGLAPVRTIGQLTSTEELMELRATAELARHPGYPPAPAELVDLALELPVHDALDAQQIQRISELSGKPGGNLQAWLDDQAELVDGDGLVKGTVQVVGTLQDTYTASRILEDRTAAIVDDRTEQSMDEVVKLAAQTSSMDELVARLMRASVLDAAGRLPGDERQLALEGYSRLVTAGCRADQALACAIAVDAAYRLDDQPRQLTMPVPEDLLEDAAGDELIYRVLATNWGVANLGQWVAAARDRGLEPLDDVADSSRPVSLRLWAAAARNVLHPELGTEAEIAVQEHLQGLVSCQGVDGLVVANGGVPSCDLDSTLAYYLSGTWGTT